MQTKTFPAPVWDAFGEASQKVYDENMSDPLFKKIFDSFRDSLAKSASWLAKSDGAYTEQRNRVLGI